VGWLPLAIADVLGIFLEILFLGLGRVGVRKPGIDGKVETCPALIEFRVLLPLVGTLGPESIV
jgi:hypothetical protein